MDKEQQQKPLNEEVANKNLEDKSPKDLETKTDTEASEKNQEKEILPEDKIKELEDNINLCKIKLGRAEQLIAGLGGEKASWTKRAEELTEKLSCVTGDVLLASS